MPAMITHYVFAQKVFAICRKADIPILCPDAALIGAQGPDLFFFHRILPWTPGESYAAQGSRLHKISPALLFEGFRGVLNQNPGDDAMLGYVQGFLCHYALDRMAHPFVYAWQEVLAQADPSYGKPGHAYHFRIESALDTIMLRRETGRLIQDYKLKNVIPPDHDGIYKAVGRLYKPIFDHVLNKPAAEENQIALAPGDMRRVAGLITDRSQMRQRLLHPLEKIIGQNHVLTSLLRPADTSDWDYANMAHREWKNPFDPHYVSTDSFFDLYALAAEEAADMIGAFCGALPEGRSMQEITQDRGFASDLPGVYGENLR